MDSTKVIQILDSASFTKVKNKRQWLKGTSVYLKKIENELFVIFSIRCRSKQSRVEAYVVTLDDLAGTDLQEPSQILFRLDVEKEKDLDYLKCYLV